MMQFVYSSHPARVVFGVGALAHLERELHLLGAQRALVLSTPEQAGQAEEVARRLGQRCAGVFARAVMHVPIETARAARAEAERLGADCAVAIGGGSTTGLGKAIALERRLGTPISLAAIGMPADGLDRAADLAACAPYPKPRSLERGATRALLDDAFHGRAPQPLSKGET